MQGAAMNPRHFLRMARWARRPPSEKRVRLVLAVLVICAVIYGVEWFFGWPAWLTIRN